MQRPGLRQLFEIDLATLKARRRRPLAFGRSRCMPLAARGAAAGLSRPVHMRSLLAHAVARGACGPSWRMPSLAAHAVPRGACRPSRRMRSLVAHAAATARPPRCAQAAYSVHVCRARRPQQAPLPLRRADGEGPWHGVARRRRLRRAWTRATRRAISRASTTRRPPSFCRCFIPPRPAPARSHLPQLAPICPSSLPACSQLAASLQRRAEEGGEEAPQCAPLRHFSPRLLCLF